MTNAGTTPFESEIQALIVDVLNLEDIAPTDIDPDEALFGTEGLALDSIDALELGVALQKKYGVKIDPEDKDLTSHFKSVRALAAFVATRANGPITA
jgi:acyl carrier protein